MPADRWVWAVLEVGRGDGGDDGPAVWLARTMPDGEVALRRPADPRDPERP